MAHTFWFTGLSGVGKTTIAIGTKNLLKDEGLRISMLDGDEIRGKIHSGFSFSPSDIKKNNLFISKICKKQSKDFDIIMVPIISPYEISRSKANELLGEYFSLIYVCAPLRTLEKRDTKGLYLKQKKGEIDNLIGVSTSNIYEIPSNYDLLINTETEDTNSSINKLYAFILEKINKR